MKTSIKDPRPYNPTEETYDDYLYRRYGQIQVELQRDFNKEEYRNEVKKRQ